MFRPCVGLIGIDADYEREDGEPSWELVKLVSKADAIAALGEGWDSGHAAPTDGAPEAEAEEEVMF